MSQEPTLSNDELKTINDAERDTSPHDAMIKSLTQVYESLDDNLRALHDEINDKVRGVITPYIGNNEGRQMIALVTSMVSVETARSLTS